MRQDRAMTRALYAYGEATSIRTKINQAKREEIDALLKEGNGTQYATMLGTQRAMTSNTVKGLVDDHEAAMRHAQTHAIIAMLSILVKIDGSLDRILELLEGEKST